MVYKKVMVDNRHFIEKIEKLAQRRKYFLNKKWNVELSQNNQIKNVNCRFY